MMRRFYALLFYLVMVTHMNGQDITVDGIKYSLWKDRSEAIIKEIEDKSYSGELIIPKTITYQGKEYIVTRIQPYAFYGCENISSAVLSESLEVIGNWAFDKCTSLETFNIPDKVWRVGTKAFTNTAWFNSLPDGLVYKDHILLGVKGPDAEGDVIIEEGTRVIAGATFHDALLTSVQIPKSVVTIGEQAFDGCSKITSVAIPASVKTIETKAFRDCETLTEIYSFIENPFDVGDAFSYSYDDADEYYNRVTLYVPIGTKSKYEATEGWKDFKNIVEMDPSGIATVHSEKNGYGAVYNLSGQRLAAPHRGLNIIGGKKVVVR